MASESQELLEDLFFINNREFGLRASKALEYALSKFREAGDWIGFFRDVLGQHSAVARLFPDTGLLDRFRATEEYRQILQMLGELRGRPCDTSEPTHVITVRMPKSVHESLRREAHQRQVSMNKLCVAKLLQLVDKDLLPSESAKESPQDGSPQDGGPRIR